jgi:predicted RNA-binding Zn ribbon-like protein
MTHGVESTARVPQPVHPEEVPTDQLSDRELLERFLSLHDHAVTSNIRLDPDAEAMTWWLRHEGGLPARRDLPDDDVSWALSVRDALFERVADSAEGRANSPRTDRLLDKAVERSGLVPQFIEGKPPLRATVNGVGGIIGRILATAFLAELQGTWDRFRICANPNCRAVFFDNSKNRSRKWCSMQTCGNQLKVRAFRERHGTKS